MNAASPPKPKNWLDPVREAQAVASLRESLAAAGIDDDETLIDTIEGETSLFEAIDKLLARNADAKAMVDGIKLAISDLQERKARFDRLVEGNRALIEQAMMIADVQKIERPRATLSLQTRQPKVEITEESDIPTRFWVTPEPELDKKALAAALKDGEAIPGATLSNSAPTLTLRAK